MLRYSDVGCSDVLFIESIPVTTCASFNMSAPASTCYRVVLSTSNTDNYFYEKRTCGSLSLVSNGDYGTIALNYNSSDISCAGSVVSRMFYRNNKCLDLALIKPRTFCSGNSVSGTVALTSCHGVSANCLTNDCVTTTASVGLCVADTDASTSTLTYKKYFCGYSASNVVEISAILTVLILALVVLAL